MEIACARVKPNINNEGWIVLKTALVDPVGEISALGSPPRYPLRFWHSSGAVDLLFDDNPNCYTLYRSRPPSEGPGA